jgi:hypothetical protein
MHENGVFVESCLQKQERIMMTRPRSVLCIAGLAAATAMTVAAQLPATALPVKSAPGVTSRGPERGDRQRGDRQRGQAAPGDQPQSDQPQSDQQPKQCPEESWNLPVQIKNVACVLLLPKPDEPAPATPPAP